MKVEYNSKNRMIIIVPESGEDFTRMKHAKAIAFSTEYNPPYKVDPQSIIFIEKEK